MQRWLVGVLAAGASASDVANWRSAFETRYDAVILGTGLKESLLAGLLANRGKKVLQLDRNEHYGGAAASLDLSQLYERLRRKGVAAPYPVDSVRFVDAPAPPPPADGDAQRSCLKNPLADGDATFALRLLEWVDGDLLSSKEITPDLLATTGAFLGRIRLALDDLDHAALHRVHLWDGRQFPALASFADGLVDAGCDVDKAADVQQAIANFDAVVAPAAAQLPLATLHGDFNDANVLVGASVPTFRP